MYNQNQPPQYPPQGGAPGRAYRRQRRVSRFQVRIGALSVLAIVAGLYLLVSGQAKNPTAAFALLGGGILVFALVVILPSLLRR